MLTVPYISSLASTMFKHPWPSHPFLPGLNLDILPLVLKTLNIDDLTRLKRVSPHADTFVTWELGRRITIALSLFINNVPHFYTMLRSTLAVISGVVAAQVFYPNELNIPITVLTIFTPHDNYQPFLDYLTEVEGYVSTSRPRGAYLRFINPMKMENTTAEEKLKHPNRVGMFIKVFQSAYTSPLPPIVSQWNTVLQGFISHTTYCSPYHFLNAQKVALFNPYYLNSLNETQEIPRGFRKEETTWKIVGQWNVVVYWLETAKCLGPLSLACPSACRFYGDLYCVTGSLHPVRDRKEVHYDAFVTYSVYWCKGGPIGNHTCYNRHLQWVHPYTRSVLQSTVQRH